ncbi:hypothetical protein GOV14_02950 [Candidatus Pacearchaeota archaeon]|nr:hypothetical protein [Candidatus Pacearchaeota archaeon]
MKENKLLITGVNSNLEFKISFIFLFFLFLIGLVSAGFASSYLPTIDGKQTLVVKQGIEKVYSIYPQNMGEKTTYIKINLSDSEGIVVNELEELYEIPPNTKSDNFEIKLNIKVPKKTEPGTTYSLTYKVLSSTEKSSTGFVTFGPVGYTKTFVVMVEKAEKVEGKNYTGLGVITGIIIIFSMMFGIKVFRKFKIRRSLLVADSFIQEV